MKISLHIEADSTEEYASCLAALVMHTMPHTLTEAVLKDSWRPSEDAPVEPSAAVEAAPEPVAEAQAEEPPAQEAAPAPAEEPAERKRRGRRPKTVPLTERAPEVAPAPAAAKSNGPAAVAAPVTRDDFNAACREYVTSYGLNFAQVDAPKLLQPVFGEHIRRSADIEEKDFAAATELMLAAVSANPFNRKRITHG